MDYSHRLCRPVHPKVIVCFYIPLSWSDLWRPRSLKAGGTWLAVECLNLTRPRPSSFTNLSQRPSHQISSYLFTVHTAPNMPLKRTLPATATTVGSSGPQTRSRHGSTSSRTSTVSIVPYVHLNPVERRSSRSAAARHNANDPQLLSWLQGCNGEPSSIDIIRIAQEVQM